MTRTNWPAGVASAAGFALLMVSLVPTARAETAETPPGPREGRPRPEHRDPLRGVLDANHDFELDADEIAKAPEAIRKLDRNGDGKVDREELRPPMGPPGDRGPGEGRPQRPGDAPGERFLQRAKEFDADGDGKLDESELKKMVESMRGGRGPGGPGGTPGEGGGRSERPRQPE